MIQRWTKSRFAGFWLLSLYLLAECALADTMEKGGLDRPFEKVPDSIITVFLERNPFSIEAFLLIT
jgi:hypothetical protein